MLENKAMALMDCSLCGDPYCAVMMISFVDDCLSQVLTVLWKGVWTTSYVLILETGSGMLEDMRMG